MNQDNYNIGQYYGSQEHSKIKKITRKEHLFIDSRYASLESSDKLDFIVMFNSTNDTLATFQPFKNVASVELKGISGNFASEKYIILDIKELNNRGLKSTVPSVNDTFCTIFCEDNKAFIKGSDFDQKIIYFDPPLSQLSQLHIKIKNHNNDLLDKDPVPVTMIFEITTIHNTIY